MKDKVAEKQPLSLPDLCRAIKEVWVKEISKEYCANLVNSMPRRLAAVLAAVIRSNLIFVILELTMIVTVNAGMKEKNLKS